MVARAVLRSEAVYLGESVRTPIIQIFIYNDAYYFTNASERIV